MSPQQLYDLANLVALVGWLALLLAAPWRRATAILSARWVAAILAGAYASLLAAQFAQGTGGMDVSTFASVDKLAAAFSLPEVLVVGWAHYLAFDLWVGAWIVEDAGTRRIGHAWVAPCLLLTFLVGPIGLLTYLVVRTVRR
jgi:hypothetical protein